MRNVPGRCIIGTFGTIKLAVEFSATNAANPPCLTQNSCLLHFRSFGFRWTNGAKLAREFHFSDFWNKKTCSRIFCNERTQSTAFDPKLMFVVFSVFWFSMDERRNSPGRPVLATFGTKKLAVEFSATNPPNPPRLTQNSCLLRFRSFSFQRVAREGRYIDFWNKKLAVEFSATNTPNPPRLTRNSCLLHFRCFGFRRTNGETHSGGPF